jgi:three-Cys-motif partner protein
VTDHPPYSRFLFDDDGLPVTAAEPWVKNKIHIIREYLASFVASQLGRVDDIIFIDLYAGNGLYSIGSRKELFPSSALMALSLDLPINKFVLCEADNERAGQLKIRVNKYFRSKNVLLLEGRPEEIMERIELYVPASKGDYKSAVFCLCDPFSFEMPFDLISRFAARNFTFLIPFTFPLSEQVDYRFYLDDQKDRIKRYVGGASHFERLRKDLESNTQFYKRLIRIYENNVLSHGLNASTSVHKLDSGLMEMPLYYMGLFSKNVSTKVVLQEVEAARHIQYDLFES